MAYITKIKKREITKDYKLGLNPAKNIPCFKFNTVENIKIPR